MTSCLIIGIGRNTTKNLNLGKGNEWKYGNPRPVWLKLHSPVAGKNAYTYKHTPTHTDMRKWRKVTELTQQISRKDVLQLQCGSGIFMAVPVARHTHAHSRTYRRAGTLTQRKQLTHTFYFWAHTHTADTGCLQYGRHLMRTTGTHTHRCITDAQHVQIFSPTLR